MNTHKIQTVPKLTAIALAAALIAAGAMSSTAHAQVQAAASPAANETVEGLAAYVVVSQKRVQPMQKVPAAVDVISAKALEDKRIVEFSDLTRVAPSLTINESTKSVALRGIGTYAFSIGVEPAVSVIVDDVPVVQQMQAFANLSDIDRVEVLRGPQGTLFGKNSSAGVINIITKESSDSLSGSIQLTATSDKEKKLETSLSGPLNDIAGYRLNTYAGKRDGYINNLTTGAQLGGERSAGIRARVDLHPSAAFKLKLIVDYATRHGDGPVAPFLSAPTGANEFGVVALAPALLGIEPGPGNVNVRLSDGGFFDNKQASLSASASWKFNSTTLTSVTTYQDWKYDFAQDADGTDLNVLNALSRGSANGGLMQSGPYRADQVTQELRLASNGDGYLNYLGGFFYSKSSSDRSLTRGPVALLTKWSAEAGNKSVAGFTQLEYQLTDTTRLSGGARVNKESIDVRFTDLLPAVPARYAGASSDTAVTGKLSLQHDLAKSVMIYGAVATGYKGAGFDISSGFNQARADRPVAPETSLAYEAGIKSRFWDNRVQLNMTAFLTDYKDFQAQAAVQDPKSGLLQLGLNNVGALRTRGIEVELSAKPVRALLLEAAAGYIDASIVKFPTANCYPGQTLAQGCFLIGTTSVQDLAGKRLANSPKFKASLSGTYDFPLSSSIDGKVNLNYQYQSDVNFDLFQNPLTIQSAYGLLNGSLTVSGASKQVKLTLFANNILDKPYVANITDNTGQFGGAHVLTGTLPRNALRYVGVRMKYEF